jgi:hypothetical protein
MGDGDSSLSHEPSNGSSRTNAKPSWSENAKRSSTENASRWSSGCIFPERPNLFPWHFWDRDFTTSLIGIDAKKPEIHPQILLCRGVRIPNAAPTTPPRPQCRVASILLYLRSTISVIVVTRKQSRLSPQDCSRGSCLDIAFSSPAFLATFKPCYSILLSKMICLSRFAFPVQFSDFARNVLLDVDRFRQSPLNVMLSFQGLKTLHSAVVRRFHQFGFPPPSKIFAGEVFISVSLFGKSPLNAILTFCALRIRHTAVVRHIRQFAFLLPSTSFAKRVFLNVYLFAQSHSKPLLTFHRSKILHSAIVQHFHQFVFLLLPKPFAKAVFLNVYLFGKSHSNRIPVSRRLKRLRSLTVSHFPQFASLLL